MRGRIVGMRWLSVALPVAGFWIGANLVLIYGFGWWSDPTDSSKGIPVSVQRQYESREWSEAVAGGEVSQPLRYRVALPTGAERTQPLLVFLHGSGQRGHDSWTETYRDPAGVLMWMYQQRNDRCEECR